MDNIEFLNDQEIAKFIKIAINVLSNLTAEDWRCWECGVKGYHDPGCFIEEVLNKYYEAQ